MADWTMATWLLLGAQIVVPILWFIINYNFRGSMGLSQSSGADAILTLLTFDVVVLIDNEAFRQVVQRVQLAANINLAHVIFLLLGLVFWNFALRYSEPSIQQAHAQAYAQGNTANDGDTAAFNWYVGWLLLLVLIILHVTFYILPTITE